VSKAEEKKKKKKKKKKKLNYVLSYNFFSQKQVVEVFCLTISFSHKQVEEEDFEVGLSGIQAQQKK
jgi:hypothetical protein